MENNRKSSSSGHQRRASQGSSGSSGGAPSISLPQGSNVIYSSTSSPSRPAPAAPPPPPAAAPPAGRSRAPPASSVPPPPAPPPPPSALRAEGAGSGSKGSNLAQALQSAKLKKAASTGRTEENGTAQSGRTGSIGNADSASKSGFPRPGVGDVMSEMAATLARRRAIAEGTVPAEESSPSKHSQGSMYCKVMNHPLLYNRVFDAKVNGYLGGVGV